MSFESALASELKGEATVSAIVGTDVYKTMCDNPDAGLARVEIVMDGGGGQARHAGGVARISHRSGRIMCRESTIALAEVLCETVRLALQRFFRGTLGNGVNVATVKRFSMRAPIDDYVRPVGGEDSGHPTRTLPFEAWVVEAV